MTLTLDPVSKAPAPLWTLRPEQPSDADAIAALVARAFGPGRYVKAVERLREGAAPDLEVSQAALLGADLIGSVRLWPIRVGETRSLLLGPIAVDDVARRRGLGAALVRAAVSAARAGGWPSILLVGDAHFFGPLGFSTALARDIRLPGPVDPNRVMALRLADGASLRGEARRAA
jgi:predicted N-acetyltransferase YhbS